MGKLSRKNVSCPVETTIETIGGKWKVLVLFYLFEGTKRFNELHRLLSGISHRTLVRQLRELEGSGIILRKVYQEIPPKVEYSLTPKGRELKSVLSAMHHWAEKYPQG